VDVASLRQRRRLHTDVDHHVAHRDQVHGRTTLP
jgi:hypothetical protein